jgi:hypothetical protein
MKTRESSYRRRIDRYGRFREMLQSRDNRISAGRGLLFFAAAAAIIRGAYSDQPAVFYVLAAVAAAAFLVAVGVHRRVSAALLKIESLLAVNREGVVRLQDGWTGFPLTGETFLEGRGTRAADLNLLGRNSLFQMCQMTATSGGAARLAARLTEGGDVAEIPMRQSAVRDLDPRLSFRQHFLIEGRGLEKRLDPAPFLDWIATPSYLTENRWLVAVQRVSVLTTLGLMVLQAFIDVPPYWIIGLLFQTAVFLGTGDRCRSRYLPSLNRDSSFLAYGAMFERIEKQRFRAEYLKNLQSRLYVRGKGISRRMRQLDRINGALCLHYNILYPFINILVLWDIHYLYRLERWKDRMRGAVGDAFDALSELEALCSLAGIAFDNPDYTYPRIEAVAPPFASRRMGHPLIPGAERVYNDFEISGEGGVALITGSNMSGKSTFVRTVGINLALAFSGGPVAAGELSARPCRVMTCIQVLDSIRLHLSHFYGEVKQIKAILEAVLDPSAPPVLYLIDEIFSGTNTKERLLASKGIIGKLAASRAFGLITTHDLELVTLAEESERIKNYHFRDEIDGDGNMVFHYRLHPGPIRSTNALEILKREGIEF